MRVNKKHRSESFDSMFKRFRKTVERSKMDYEQKRREYYEKPSSVRKRAKEYARKQELKRQQDRLLITERHSAWDNYIFTIYSIRQHIKF